MQETLISNLSQLFASNAISGAASGFVIGIFLQPLEIVKLCLIINPPPIVLSRKANFAQSFYLSAQSVYRIEGAKGFWKGLSPALMRIGAASGIYFHFLEIFNKKFAHLKANQRVIDFTSSCSARTLSTIIINPLTVMKTRMELPGQQFNYKGVDDAIKTIYKQEGVKTFFKGSSACILRDVPFAGLYYTIMNISKEELKKIKVKAATSTMISGMIAGLIATAATHPFEVARAHLQIDSSKIAINTLGESNGTFGILSNIVKNEGPIGLFRGLQARLMRKPLSNALTFTFFEIFQNMGATEKKFL